MEYLCSCSFLEIYNEQVYDLLDTSSTGLHLRENIKRGVYVDGLSEETVSSAKEAYDVSVLVCTCMLYCKLYIRTVEPRNKTTPEIRPPQN